MSVEAEKKAKEWFIQNYHTPMDSFLGKYGVPVLHGVYPDGQEDWENIPIEKVLLSYLQHRLSQLTDERIEEIVEQEWVKYDSGETDNLGKEVAKVLLNYLKKEK